MLVSGISRLKACSTLQAIYTHYIYLANLLLPHFVTELIFPQVTPLVMDHALLSEYTLTCMTLTHHILLSNDQLCTYLINVVYLFSDI